MKMLRRNRRLSAAIAGGLLALGLLAIASPQAIAGITLKMATLAPKKSTWYRTFAAINADIVAATGGAVSIKIYPGGIHGDEKVTINKMKTGLIHASAVTSVGLAAIDPDIIAFQLPYLFKSYKELDCVRDSMRAELDAKFEAKGYKILGWGDIGYLYVFSNEEIHDPKDLGKVKLWSWTEDPITAQIAEVVGASTVPLAVPDVLPSLSTGVINAFSSSPYATLVLGWGAKVTHMAGSPVGIGIGASVMSKKAYDSIPEAHRKLLKEISERRSKELVSKIRADNSAAVKALRRNGLKVYALSPAEKAEWGRISVETAKRLTGKVYSAAFFNKVKATLAGCR